MDAVFVKIFFTDNRCLLFKNYNPKSYRVIESIIAQS